jgi:hypothetical protein
MRIRFILLIISVLLCLPLKSQVWTKNVFDKTGQQRIFKEKELLHLIIDDYADSNFYFITLDEEANIIDSVKVSLRKNLADIAKVDSNQYLILHADQRNTFFVSKIDFQGNLLGSFSHSEESSSTIDSRTINYSPIGNIIILSEEETSPNNVAHNTHINVTCFDSLFNLNWKRTINGTYGSWHPSYDGVYLSNDNFVVGEYYGNLRIYNPVGDAIFSDQDNGAHYTSLVEDSEKNIISFTTRGIEKRDSIGNIISNYHFNHGLYKNNYRINDSLFATISTLIDYSIYTEFDIEGNVISYLTIPGRVSDLININNDYALLVGKNDDVDSVFIRKVFHYNYPVDTIYIEKCPEEMYFVGNSFVRDEGVYYNNDISNSGFDSVTVVIINNYKSDTIVYKEYCDSDSVFFKGQYFKSDFIGVDTINSTHGCDSIITTNFKFHPSYYNEENISVFIHDTFQFHDGVKMLIDTSIIYTSYLNSINGCDSIIQTIVNAIERSSDYADLPYYNNFDNHVSDTNWQFYAQDGYSLWSISNLIDNANIVREPISVSGALIFNNSDTAYETSISYAESPSFNLNTTCDFYLNFKHMPKDITAIGNVQFSTDGGITWDLLNGSSIEKKSWFTHSSIKNLDNEAGFYYSNKIKKSYIDLSFLNTHNNVKFRFKSYVECRDSEGWIIDDYTIDTLRGIYTGYNSGDVIIPIGFNNLSITHNYKFTGYPVFTYRLCHSFYLSHDTVFDDQDFQLEILDNYMLPKSENDYSSRSYELSIPDTLKAGDYFVLHKHRIRTSIPITYNRSLTYNKLEIREIYDSLFKDNFESDSIKWIPSDKDFWKKGKGNYFHVEDSYSGQNAYYTDYSAVYDYTSDYIHSPFISTDTTDCQLCFKYKTKQKRENGSSMYVHLINYDTSYQSKTQETVRIQQPKYNGWNSFCTRPVFIQGNSISAISIGVEWDLHHGSNTELMQFDDVYIGPAKSNLNIISEKKWFIHNQNENDTIALKVVNDGLVASEMCDVKFYASMDSLFDPYDSCIFTSSIPDISDTSLAKLDFALSTTLFLDNHRYLIVQLDAENLNDESWESDNITVIQVIENNVVNTPYEENFELEEDVWYSYYSFGKNYWSVENTDSIYDQYWFSNSKACVVSIDSMVNSRMHLISPFIDLSNLVNPVLQFEALFKSNDLNISYSTDGGMNWFNLDTSSLSFKSWYGLPKSDLFYSTEENTLLNSYTSHEVTTKNSKTYNINLDKLSDKKHVIFRFNFSIESNDSNLTISKDKFLYMDNFKIVEGIPNLTIPYKTDLQLSQNSKVIQYGVEVHNNGTLRSDSSLILIYLSEDNTFDFADVIIDTIYVNPINPDRFSFVSSSSSIDSIFDYNYLHYVIDYDNMIPEIDETDNIQTWSLAVDSLVLDTFYLNSFVGEYIDGWKAYGSHPRYRMRHVLHHNEHIYSSKRVDYEWSLSGYRMHNLSTSPPIWYLESPSFDLSNMDSIYLGFKYLSIAQNQQYCNEGGNLEYSKDGGLTWNLIGDFRDTLGANWYNLQETCRLNDEPSWSGSYGYKIANYNLNYLFENEDDIVFRFKFRGVYQPFSSEGKYGFRLDNFQISSRKLFTDLELLTNITETHLENEDTFHLPVQVNYTGNQPTSETKLYCYWSEDSVRDASDRYIKNIPIQSFEKLNSQSIIETFHFPSWSCDSVLYLMLDLNPAYNQFTRPFEETDYQNNIVAIKVKKNLPAYIPIRQSREFNPCVAQEITLSIDDLYMYNWSNGSTKKYIEVQNNGSFYANLTNVYGCEFVTDTVKYFRSSHDIYVRDTSVYCGDSLFFGSTYLKDEGSYFDSLFNQFLCDSIIQLNLTIQPKPEMVIDTSVCNFLFFGSDSTLIDTSGSYIFTYQDANLCDSVIRLHVNVLEGHFSTDTLYVCDSVLLSDGRRVFESGDYMVYYENANGCDSLIEYNINIEQSQLAYLNVTSCDSYVVPFDSSIIDSSGLYTYYFEGINGCDSIIYLTVNIVDSSIITRVNIEECDYFIVPIDSTIIYNSGIFTYNLLNNSGCDSLVIFDVIINTSSYQNLSLGSCYPILSPSGKYEYANTGVYSDTISNQFGCDSILSLNITIFDRDSVQLSFVGCDSILNPKTNKYWHSSGLYVDTLSNVFGCDSLIYSSVLLAEPTVVSIDTTVCDSFVLFNNKIIYDSGHFYDTLNSSLGCDSIIQFEVNVLKTTYSQISVTSCEAYTSPSGLNVWSESGTYVDYLMNTQGCDSIVVINLSIHKLDTSIHISNDTLFALNHANYNYQWFTCTDSLEILANDTLFFLIPESSGTYGVIIYNNKCSDTTSCHFLSKTLNSDVFHFNTFKIYPNPSAGIFHIEFQEMKDFVVFNVYDLQWNLVHTNECYNCMSKELNIVNQQSILILETIINNNVSSYNKLIMK